MGSRHELEELGLNAEKKGVLPRSSQVSEPEDDNVVKKIVDGFLNSTTVAGLPRIFEGRGPIVSSFWDVAFILAMAASVWQIEIIFEQYFERDVNVRIKVVTTQGLPFPSVSICNTNKFRKSAISMSPYSKLVTVDTEIVRSYYALQCLEGDFPCNNSGCIKPYLLCDGYDNCGDRSDEKNCDYGSCSNDLFKCKTGSDFGVCINLNSRCDRILDCYGGEDEDDCECIDKKEYKCSDTGRCIKSSKRCDGVDDCVDGNDEKNCEFCYFLSRKHADKHAPNYICQLTQLQLSNTFFQCDDGRTCFPQYYRCDGDFDCLDKTDETGCANRSISDDNVTCPDTMFKCEEKCIQDMWVCDGFVDCLDAKDEIGCHIYGVIACNDMEFLCDLSQCIPNTWLCDGMADCFDETDEDMQNCYGGVGECFFDSRGIDYRGTANITVGGNICQKWNAQTPHSHIYTPHEYNSSGITNHNYCRNPSESSATWCYTTDPMVRWDWCDIGEPGVNCKKPVDACYNFELRCDETCIHKMLLCVGIKHCPSGIDEENCGVIRNNSMFIQKSECFYGFNGEDYRGLRNFTIKGKPCQKWTEQTPHAHAYTEHALNNSAFGDHNYCRNTGRDQATWCFTTDPAVRWQWCSIGDPGLNCGDTCDKPNFECSDSFCIPGDWVCNGIRDCFEGEDEAGCEYSTDVFICDGGKRTINIHFLCDYYFDCEDATDEEPRNCPNVTIPKAPGFPVFRCFSNGKEVPQFKVCNNVIDCNDASDELECAHGERADYHLTAAGLHSLYSSITNDMNVFNEFVDNIYQDHMLGRVTHENPPDWNGFIAYSNAPDNSDLVDVLKLPVEKTAKYGHQLNDFVLECTFDGNKCNMSSDFKEFYDGRYGNCFQFNPYNNDRKHGHFSTKTGAKYGLKMTLFTEQNEYISIYGRDSGARVVIHHPTLRSMPESEGITIPPGIITSLGMKETRISRQPDPYGNCTQQKYFDKNHELFYSQTICEESCLQDNMLKYCGCVDTMLRGEPQCLLLNRTQDSCKQLIQFFARKLLLGCKCPQPCTQSWYSTTVSQSLHPSNSFLKHLLKQIHHKNAKTKVINDLEGFRQNIVQLEVYFEELNYETITEVPDITMENLLGNIGGILGLYCGFCVMTVVELIQLGCDLIRAAWIKKSKTH
ncbi:uncharacterized protein LOC102808992 [Saccoglossus kowalevskii]